MLLSGESNSNELGLEPAPKTNFGCAWVGEACTLSMRVVFADDSDVRELGGDVGAIGARPDTSAISRRGRSQRRAFDYVTNTSQPIGRVSAPAGLTDKSFLFYGSGSGWGNISSTSRVAYSLLEFQPDRLHASRPLSTFTVISNPNFSPSSLFR